jgi:(p)ppGpp synthase/HD superfamily hydrolase
MKLIDNLTSATEVLRKSLEDFEATLVALRSNFQSMDKSVQEQVKSAKEASAANNKSAVESALAEISKVSTTMSKDAQTLVVHAARDVKRLDTVEESKPTVKVAG